jgi:hypothetical protein
MLDAALAESSFMILFDVNSLCLKLRMDECMNPGHLPLVFDARLNLRTKVSARVRRERQVEIADSTAIKGLCLLLHPAVYIHSGRSCKKRNERSLLFEFQFLHNVFQQVDALTIFMSLFGGI